MFGKKYYLTADIGGTNCRLAVLSEDYSKIFQKNYDTQSMQSISDAINIFLKEPEVSRLTIKEACLAIAGPISADRITANFTNANLLINTSEIISKTPLKRVVLINDFEAIGFSLDVLKPEQYFEFTQSGRKLDGTIAIIGAGTGLGTSIVPLYGRNHVPLPSEGGHTDIPLRAENKMELDLYQYMHKKKQILEIESILSGRGILTIYNFLVTKKFKQNAKTKAEIAKVSDDNKPALVTKFALEDRDALCIKTVELFIMFYARAARNLALTSMSSELVIAGGIAPKILPMMKDVFLEEFVKHDRENYTKILEQMTVLVITDTDIGLYGCAHALRVV